MVETMPRHYLYTLLGICKKYGKMRQKPKQNTEVKHSQSKNAWNVVGTDLGGKYKIARVPYQVVEGSEIITTRNKAEALEHAMYISWCFCNPDKVQY
jgi:ribosomal protein L20A (L18A)